MQKIVINKCHGGFQLSVEAERMYTELKGKQVFFYQQSKPGGIDEFIRVDNPTGKEFLLFTLTKDLGETVSKLPNDDSFWLDVKAIPRDDPDLVKIVKELKERANTRVSKLKIVSIPDGVKWQIEEYDGMEWIAEEHQTWG